MKCSLSILLVTLSIDVGASELKVNPSEIKQYDPSTGIGCTQSAPNERDIIHIECRSKISAESAWNAAMYKAKFACESQLFDMLFENNPTLPVVDGTYGIQIDLKCAIRP